LVPEKEESAPQHTEELQTWFQKNYDKNKKNIRYRFKLQVTFNNIIIVYHTELNFLGT
jgi:hypothetical protein